MSHKYESRRLVPNKEKIDRWPTQLSKSKRAGEPAQAVKQTANQPAPQAPQVLGGSYEFHTDQWATLCAKRIDEMIAALKSKGVPIFWVGLPAIRGTKSTNHRETEQTARLHR